LVPPEVAIICAPSTSIFLFRFNLPRCRQRLDTFDHNMRSRLVLDRVTASVRQNTWGTTDTHDSGLWRVARQQCQWIFVESVSGLPDSGLWTLNPNPIQNPIKLHLSPPHQSLNLHRRGSVIANTIVIYFVGRREFFRNGVRASKEEGPP
jgi:hypothetical protein